jgi:hypothetical protein
VGIWGGDACFQRGEHCLVKAKTHLLAGKVLTTIFWDWKGILLIDFLHERRTVNALYYCQLLDNVKVAYKIKRGSQPIRNVILLHDYALPTSLLLKHNNFALPCSSASWQMRSGSLRHLNL